MTFHKSDAKRLNDTLVYDINTARRFCDGTYDWCQNRQTDEETKGTWQQIDSELSRFVPLVRELVRELERQPYSDDALMASLRQAMQREPGLYGVGVAFAPGTHPSGKRLFAPYLQRDDENFVRRQLEDFYDYSASDKRWYDEPIASGTSLWMDLLGRG